MDKLEKDLEGRGCLWVSNIRNSKITTLWDVTARSLVDV
jgi:hypothetical protein